MLLVKSCALWQPFSFPEILDQIGLLRTRCCSVHLQVAQLDSYQLPGNYQVYTKEPIKHPKDKLPSAPPRVQLAPYFKHNLKLQGKRICCRSNVVWYQKRFLLPSATSPHLLFMFYTKLAALNTPGFSPLLIIKKWIWCLPLMAS